MIRVEINQKGIQLDGVRKFVTDALKQKYPKASVNVTRDTTGTSRADQLSEAESLVEDAKSIVEGLRDELQEWLDSLPENLQNGSKADELNDAISELDSINEALENVEMSGVSFPGMY